LRLRLAGPVFSRRFVGRARGGPGDEALCRAGCAETAICVVDEDGVIIREGFAASEPADIAAWLAKLDLPFERVGLEAGATSGWLYTELRAAGLPAICIDPRHLRGLTKTMPVKSDRNDARAIAHCMRVAWFSVVHVKSAISQELRMLLVNRRTLLTKQIDLENEFAARCASSASNLRAGSLKPRSKSVSWSCWRTSLALRPWCSRC
jgi:transposase